MNYQLHDRNLNALVVLSGPLVDWGVAVDRVDQGVDRVGHTDHVVNRWVHMDHLVDRVDIGCMIDREANKSD